MPSLEVYAVSRGRALRVLAQSLSAVDILAMANLLNYFGKCEWVRGAQTRVFDVVPVVMSQL